MAFINFYFVNANTASMALLLGITFLLSYSVIELINIHRLQEDLEKSEFFFDMEKESMEINNVQIKKLKRKAKSLERRD